MVIFMRPTFTIDEVIIVTDSPIGIIIAIRLTFGKKRVVSVILVLMWNL